MPYEDGGPALCREYRRSWSDSSSQDSTHTAATRRAESVEFFKTHPWVKKNIGGISDGASNYSSTSAAIYGLLDDFTTAQVISVEGMGKDNIDRDNGSEQGKLRAANARMDLTFTKEYIKACNARRHRGAINARVEMNHCPRLTPDQKKSIKAIDHVQDMKVRAKGDNGSLVLWELFSRRLSARAGKVVGYGCGRVITKVRVFCDELSTPATCARSLFPLHLLCLVLSPSHDPPAHNTHGGCLAGVSRVSTAQAALTERHGLELHKPALADGVVTMEYPETAALPEGQSVRHNPAPCLSSSQKKDTAAAAAALKDEKQKEREARKTAVMTKVQATYNGHVVLCDRCGAKFKTLRDGRPPAAFEVHRRSDCGRFAAGVKRKREHDAGTIRARVQLHDDDLADEAELAEEQGLDLISATFSSSSWGWSLAADDQQQYPSGFRGLRWAAVGAPAELEPQSRVRIEARHFGEVAVDDFGTEWNTSHYYGRVNSTSSGRVSVQFDDGPFPCHYTQLELGVNFADETPGGPAVVESLSVDGAARRQIVHVGCTVVRVGDVETPTLASAQAQLDAAAPSNDKPLTVVLRRPAPKAQSWRGAARSAANRRPPHEWHENVTARCDALLEDPRFARRSNAVYEALKVDFGHATENGKCLLPPLKDVEARMLTAFKKKQQAARDGAQDSAARALAAAAAADVPDEGVDSDEDEIVGYDDGTRAAPAAGGGSDSTAAGSGGGGGGDATGAGDSSETEQSEEDAHYAALGGVQVAVLRARLRENDNEALNLVRAEW